MTRHIVLLVLGFDNSMVESASSRASRKAGSDPILTRRRTALLGVALAFGSTGCLDFFDDDSDQDGQKVPAFESVPHPVDGLMHVDGRLPADNESVALLDEVVQGGSGVRDESGSLYVRLLAAIQDEHDSFDSATIFFRNEPEGSTAYAAILVQVEADSESVVEITRDVVGDMSDSSHDGGKIYTSPTVQKAQWVRRLDEGLVVVGTEPAVRGCIETHAGKADAFAGDLETAYSVARDGRITLTLALEGGELAAAASEISSRLTLGLTLLEEFHVLTFVYTEYADVVPLELQMTMESNEDAESSRETIQHIIDREATEGSVEDIPIEERAIYDRISVDRTENHLTLEVLVTPSEIVRYFDVYAEALADELGHEDALSTNQLSP